jgi:hypothetical protein
VALGFTGFPSRGGHFGIRRLNVSFGLGPQGAVVESARGTPRSRGGQVVAPVVASDVVAFLAQGESAAPVAILTPSGFVLVADIAAYLARVSPEHPLARGDVVAPSLAPADACAPQERRPGATAEASAPAAASKAPRTRARAAVAAPSSDASQPSRVRASSTDRKPAAKSSSSGPTIRKKR